MAKLYQNKGAAYETYFVPTNPVRTRKCEADVAIDSIKRLPHVKPEQKTAMWLIHKWGDDAKCSNCGKHFDNVYDMETHDRFCRFCGAKMIRIKGIK